MLAVVLVVQRIASRDKYPPCAWAGMDDLPLPSPEDMLRELVLDVRTKIADRRALNCRLSRTWERMIVNIEVTLQRTVLNRGMEYAALIERRTILEREITRCQGQILAEELNCWRDVAQLEVELRGLQRELRILGAHEN